MTETVITEKKEKRNFFKPLSAAVKMQMREKTASSKFFSEKPAFFRYIFEILKLLIITASFYGIYYVLTSFSLISLSNRVPSNFLLFIYTIALAILIFTSAFSLTKKLYFSTDNNILFILPLTHFQVFLSKLIVFWLGDIKRNATVFFPIFVAAGIVSGLSYGYYLWLIPAFCVVSLITLSLGTILSVLFMFIGRLLSRFKYNGLILIILFIIGFIFLFWFVQQNIPENFNLVGRFGYYYRLIKDFLTNFSRSLPPMRWVTELIVGSRYDNSNQFIVTSQMGIIYGLLLGVVVAVATIGFFLQRFFFYRMATSERETTNTKVTKPKKNKLHRPFLSGLILEWKEYGRHPVQFFSRYLLLFLLPFISVIAAILVQGMNARFAGYQIMLGFLVMGALMCLLISNGFISSLLSKDGKSSYVLKTTPVSPQTLIAGKLLTHAVIHIVVVSALVISLRLVFTSLPTEPWLYVVFGLLFLDFGHILFSLGLDISNPQTQRYINGIALSMNPNQTKSTIAAYVIAAAYGGIYLYAIFAISFERNDTFGILWRLMIAAIFYFAFYVFVYIRQYKTYMREF